LPVSSELEEQSSRAQEWRQMGTALHDLCQPLTTLQCQLEMAEMIGTAEAYREAVAAALAECGRLCAAVASLRSAVSTASQRAASAL